MTRKRPTIDQIIAELERLELKEAALIARGGSRYSVNHALRLWADGAKHALAWAAGRTIRATPQRAFAVDRPPTAAIELLELALRPRKSKRPAVQMP